MPRPCLVDSGEQVIRVDSGPDEDDIPNPQDIAVTPEKVGSANFRKLADDVTSDMLPTTATYGPGPRTSPAGP